jgi:GT2 family glycosyltransferase
MDTIAVILDYRGGARTDGLRVALQSWNTGMPVLVLDNGSPDRRASVIAKRNPTNRYIGNGIKDCLWLARQRGARFCFFCANDVKPIGPIDILALRDVMARCQDVVQISCAVTPDAAQADHFPWMVARAAGGFRHVRHADMLACLLRLDFIDSFGGFPDSVGGWGYDRELGWHAQRLGQRILICDDAVVEHVKSPELRLESGDDWDRRAEMRAIYARRYPADPVLDFSCWSVPADEEQAL